ncbi:hypothetical protein ACIQYS_14950 [Psychrobacillus sp. NPDC096426]|uniref:hypothetical protein n=1 Tax=Psychrobacillus sp. NPDC096426 TaxID=3364491 RepID=UPI0037F619C0
MSKGWFVFLLGISTLIMYPSEVHGEESDNEKRGLLSESITQVVEKTEIITEEVNSTLDNTLSVEKIVEITTVVEPAVGIVKKVEEKTSPVVAHAITEVPSTTESIVSEVMNLVDETVEIVPEVPIVTPVLTEVIGSVKKVTNSVEEVVEQGTDTVLAVIDKKDLLIPEEKSPISTKQLEKVEEPGKVDTVPQAEENKVPQKYTIPTAKPEKAVTAIKESPQQNQPTVEESIEIVEKELFEISHVNQEKAIKGKVDV